MSVRFNGKDHEKAFYDMLHLYNIDSGDPERMALVYTLTITEDCRKHFSECYDRESRCVEPAVLSRGWVTSTDARAIRLAYNLFNGGVPTALINSPEKEDNLFDSRGDFKFRQDELLKSTPAEIFSDGSIRDFFLEAIRVRFDLF